MKNWSTKIAVLTGPFEFMLALACVIAGPVLLSGIVPSSINSELSDFAKPLWAIEVFLSGLFILLGIWYGWRLSERIGLAMQAGTSAVYGIAIWVNLGAPAIIAVLFYLVVLCGGSLLRLIAMREADRTRERLLSRGA